MDEKNNRSAQPLTASAKRRRRRRRAAGKSADSAAPVREEKQDKPAQQKSANRGQGKQQGTKQENRPQANVGRNTRSAQKSIRQERVEPVRPERTSRPERNKPVQPKEEDPGLLLISRKPPAQKFANFEEYMKSRGGFSEPISADEEE